jgi:hypothetical protein
VHRRAVDIDGEDEDAAGQAGDLVQQTAHRQPRHVQVEHGHVGSVGADPRERLGPVVAERDDVEVGRCVDRRGEPVDVDPGDRPRPARA